MLHPRFSVQAFQLALALRQEVAALEAAGCTVVQVREITGVGEKE
jgi:methionine synthase II (cobalamin-independent)